VVNIKIELRGETFFADEPTDSEMLSLASIFLPGETEESRMEGLQRIDPGGNILSLDLQNPIHKRQATAILVSRLMNPIVKARVAHAVKCIFPTLPDKWVNYGLIKLTDGRSLEDFRLKLNNNELLEIVKKVLKSIPSSADLKRPQQQSNKPILINKKRR
jgi:hypothetical protein